MAQWLEPSANKGKVYTQLLRLSVDPPCLCSCSLSSG